ncbi:MULTISPECIES: MFS transporter [unclassified Streptomyces]|uniref:MFS transporter n=1 Tax=unclassified Streptomyces TaxID=2593676 RepID=UPI0029663639|nr:MFS transporter [Streptomyces sp. SJL17-1]
MGTIDPAPRTVAPHATETLGPSGPLSAPRAPVSAGFIAALTAAFLFTWMALLPATQVTLALRVQQIAPQDKAAALSLVLAVGAVVALLAQNIFGVLSDRTTSRFGMRRPWILIGALLGVASLGFLATADSIASLVASWALTQLTFNILLAGLTPVIPDQIPPAQLGRVSALTGITTQVGVVGGVFLTQLLLPDLTTAILLPGLFCLIGVGVLTVVLRDRQLAPADRRPLRPSVWLQAYWVSPRKHPDFAWAWLSRFLVQCGNITLTSYQTYFLMSRFGYTEDTVGPVVLKVLLVSIAGIVLAAMVFGALSDRLQRRKPFVLVSAVVLALAHVLAAFATSLTMFLISAAITGVAAGCFLAVDLALVTQVLPSSADAGKDMGVLHLASALPQMLMPAIAPLFLAIGDGDNYAAFFIAGGVIGLIGAFCNQRIRSVR